MLAGLGAGAVLLAVFVSGMDLVLLVCGIASALAAVLVAAFLPGSTAGGGKTAESGHELTTAR
ncbi:hypothetical protein [Microbispora sp. NPDC046933]|uniref:hypothetical protein n=1 Tax=Microbispora sp. NPDC046933 TaxID=3155618 RepID=UPI0033C3EA15